MKLFSTLVFVLGTIGVAPAATPPAPALDCPGNTFSGGANAVYGDRFYGKSGVNYVYAVPSGNQSQMRHEFTLAAPPAEPLVLYLDGLDDDSPSQCHALVQLNGKELHRGVTKFGFPEWTRQEFAIPAGCLKQGRNELLIANLEPAGGSGQAPWLMVSRCVIAPPGFSPRPLIAIARASEKVGSPVLVGTARIDITPTHPVLLNGYASRPQQMTLEVKQPLHARAIAIGGDDTGPAVLIAVDNLGIPASMHQAVARALEAKYQIPRARVTINASHTHGAPILPGVANNIVLRELSDRERASMDRYAQELTQKLIMVAEAAVKNRIPCHLFWGKTTADFAINRRAADGPVDRALPVLCAKDEAGTIRAVVTNYACHCVAAGTGQEICGDWSGYATEKLEALLPDAVAMNLAGCGGDQNPAQKGSLQAARAQGISFAESVIALPGDALTALDSPPQTRLAEIELPLASPLTLEEWKSRAGQGGIVGFHAGKNVQRLERGETLPTAISYPIQTWTFGDDLAMVFLGGEVVVDYSLRLSEVFDGTRLWVSGYTNDAPCYIPSERILREGGYEGADAMLWYDKPRPFAPGLEKRILDEVGRQLGGRFDKSTNPRLTGGTRPLSPAESIARMQTHDNLKIELVAAEPLVVDPVAIDFGHDGKLWVAEMCDYPEGIDGHYKPGGRIKYLEDTNGDGIYDRATVLLEGVPFPTGVMAWRKGVLVCAAPDILYAEDTDGDGKADKTQKIFTGFETHNYQARVNSLSLGLDNWIHGAAGIFGGVVKTSNERVVDTSNRDFRCLPDSATIEPSSGRTQQGRARDDWGNWFGCENGTLLYHYPLTEHYLARNPYVVAPSAALSIAASQTLFPRGQLVTWSQSGPPGVPTAACGLGIYRATLLGPEYENNAFICEPVNQLVHRLQLKPEGISFSAQRPAGETDREFLSSTDNWFRPAQARTGPDGALYIVDMYRYLIEHPKFLTPEARAQVYVRAGDRLGRIYRIVPQHAKPEPVPQLSTSPVEQVVAALSSANGTLRDMAHLELLWRGDRQAVAPLVTLAQHADLPQSRLQALCALDGLRALNAEIVQRALADSHPAVRRHAIRLAEPFVNDSPALAAAVVASASDADSQIRQQAAYSLGAWHDAAAGKALARVLSENAGAPYIQSAALSSINATNASSVVATLLSIADRKTGLDQTVDTLLTIVTQLGDRAMLAGVLNALLTAREDGFADWQLAAMPKVWPAVVGKGVELSDSQRHGWQAMLKLARKLAADTEADTARRESALALLAFSSESDDLQLLAERCTAQDPPAIQQAAVAALAKIETPAAADAILDALPQLTPDNQSAALDHLLARTPLTQQLLSRLEAGSSLRGLLDAGRRQALLEHPSELIRSRAAKLFLQPSGTGATAQLAAYRQVDPARGNAQQGREIFTRHCAACHQLHGVGHVVGPDLAALSDKSAQALVTSIVVPNDAVDRRYATYSAVTVDGVIYTGLLTNESANSITLKAQEGKEQVILRKDLEQLQSHGKSLMPEGLGNELPPEAMQDLLTFVVGPAVKFDSVRSLQEMLAGIQVGTADEYRKIPDMFQFALDAGRRDDGDELAALLSLSLPRLGEPLRHWQAVVVGGGLVNGLSQQNVWPSVRIAQIVSNDKPLQQRWEAALQQAVTMADDEQVTTGTRYDALRLVAMLPLSRVGKQLDRYLGSADETLQQGAVSGLCDIPEPAAAVLLNAALPGLTAGNRQRAVTGLLRLQSDHNGLLLAIQHGALPAESVAKDVRDGLLHHSNPAVAAAAKTAFDK